MMKKIAKSYDYSLILAIFLLVTFGLVMVYSSSMITAVARFHVESDYFFEKQVLAAILGMIAFTGAALIPYRAYLNSKFIKTLIFASILGLICVFIFGHVAGNAQSWIKLAGRSIQPGEFVKLSVIIYLAAVYEKKQSYINKFGAAVLPPLLFTFVICLFVAVQPDLGTAMIIGLIALTMVVCSGMGLINLVKLAVLGFAGLAAMTPFLLLNHDKIITPTRIARFTGFMDPFKTQGTEGYQLVNSYYAIGSGGLTGLGLGQSVQKYGYLPESHTDFIMAIIAEETGIFGVLFVLITLCFIIFKGFHIARKCQDAFGTLLAVGISSMLGIQAFINLGGLTGLIPITGVTLPFISYGGSSLLLLLISMGILVNVSMFVNYRNNYLNDGDTVSNVTQIGKTEASY
ncbi:cell division protein FtsW [Bacillus lacus]|uniref:Probable peptidoglycan glycosyltransferase FtsW n=1 Tax=Metabacillus lacus TaxID=1983721 RepID=A0A7X2IXK8_9BACI|nr:FtsW/RodA/SpoVE family cell cycle protein [Metabacillus lacus]MRX71687.1 cell division protein FtsW [Metabacillus lacus]